MLSLHRNADGRRSGGRLIPLLLLLILAALVVLIVLLFQRSSAPAASSTAVIPGIFAQDKTEVGTLSGRTDEEIQAELNRRTAEHMISFKLNNAPVFEDGSAEGDLALESPEANPSAIRFQISRNDTGEILYDSGAMAPQTYIAADKLQTEEPLPKGEYPCTATIDLLSGDTKEVVGRVQAAMTVTIQK